MGSPVVLVTGATSGIGRETARQLAARNTRVIVHGRTEDRAARVATELGGSAAGHGSVGADLGSLEQVRSMAAELLATWGTELQVVVNNAGTYQPERAESEDGYELTFQVNHLAPFLLTNLVREGLANGSALRVITVSSSAHSKGTIDFDDLMNERDYDAYDAYADSKLANVLFAYALARRFDPSGLGETFRVSMCLDPGATDTRMLALAHPRYNGRPVNEAAEGIVCLAADRLPPDANGTYFRDCAARHSARTAYDTELQDRLWTLSAGLVDL